jgi:prepilin-type N-terminal cleavage/methylation domain-containing protein
MIDWVRKRKGLTLVELIIAFAIFAVLTLAMLPGIGNWLPQHCIKGLARDVPSCFRLAQMTAVQRNQTSRVHFDNTQGTVTVLDAAGAPLRALDLGDYRSQFDSFDFAHQGGDELIDIFYNTRGIPTDEESSPLTPPGGQQGQRVFLENSRGEEGYWVEVIPVGNVRYDKYRGWEKKAPRFSQRSGRIHPS